MLEGQGANHRRKYRAHSLAAIVAALLLVLQSLFAGVAGPAQAPRLGAAAGLAPICALDDERGPDDSGPKAPAHDHARSHCCLPGESCDGSAPPLLIESHQPPDRPPILARLSLSPLREAPRRPPAGWASSWSSRAPPLFS